MKNHYSQNRSVQILCKSVHFLYKLTSSSLHLIFTKRLFSFRIKEEFDVLLSLQSVFSEDPHGTTNGAFAALSVSAAAAAALALGVLLVAAACSGFETAARSRSSKTLDK